MTGAALVVVGVDNGGTTNNVTVLDVATGSFLVAGLLESPSLVREGPAVAVPALVRAVEAALRATGCRASSVAAVGLDSPGPASADGVISSVGATNFLHPDWRGFDLRLALEQQLHLPVVYNNDGNAASLYAHDMHHGADGGRRSSVSAVIGTGLGGGIVVDGTIVRGVAGMAGELGHVHIPLQELLEPDQPVPRCNCGFRGDAESIASLTGIALNLLPYWLRRYPSHPLAAEPDVTVAAKKVRSFGEAGDEMARRLFDQQARAVGALFTIVANVLDPDTYFVGGGVVEASEEFRAWFLDRVRAHTFLREEQRRSTEFAVVPDLDMAGARGSALAAAASVTSPASPVARVGR